MGAAVYDVRPSATPCALSTGLVRHDLATGERPLPRAVERQRRRDSILDKVNNQQLLSAPIRWDFLYDLSTTWPAWEIQYNNVVAAPTSYLAARRRSRCWRTARRASAWR